MRVETPASEATLFPIRRSPWWVLLLLLFGATPGRSHVELADDRLVARFGWLFHHRFPLASIEGPGGGLGLCSTVSAGGPSSSASSASSAPAGTWWRYVSSGDGGCRCCCLYPATGWASRRRTQRRSWRRWGRSACRLVATVDCRRAPPSHRPADASLAGDFERAAGAAVPLGCLRLPLGRLKRAIWS
jgi:hypothetical protein